jgi:hypothetical protein
MTIQNLLLLHNCSFYRENLYYIFGHNFIAYSFISAYFCRTINRSRVISEKLFGSYASVTTFSVWRPKFTLYRLAV